MKFMCLMYEEEEKLNALSRDDWAALRDETIAYVETLRAAGSLVATHALQSTRKAATVRVRDGRPRVTDGPFAEAKEVVGGFFVIEARDRDEASSSHRAGRRPGSARSRFGRSRKLCRRPADTRSATETGRTGLSISLRLVRRGG